MPDARLADIFRQHLPQVHFQRIETSIARGIPDLNGAINGIEFWLELKRAKHFKVAISSGQVAWIERRTLRARCRVFIAVRQLSTNERREALWLYHGADVRRLAVGSLRDVTALGHWPGRPSQWPWATILNMLVT